MSRNNQSRHTVPQHLTGAGDPMWTGDVPDASVPDTLDGSEDWMVSLLPHYQRHFGD